MFSVLGILCLICDAVKGSYLNTEGTLIVIHAMTMKGECRFKICFFALPNDNLKESRFQEGISFPTRSPISNDISAPTALDTHIHCSALRQNH